MCCVYMCVCVCLCLYIPCFIKPDMYASHIPFATIFPIFCCLRSSMSDSQVHYEWWRKILKYFWMSVVIYTMLVLIFIYTYQFENFPGLWQNMTGLKKEK